MNSKLRFRKLQLFRVMKTHLQNQNRLLVAYLFRGKSLSDLSTFKAKEDEHSLQRVLRSPHEPGFRELDSCSSIHFYITYSWAAAHRV